MGEGKHGSAEVTITLDDAGGTPRTITNYILDMDALKITAGMQPSTAYGDAWEEILMTGVKKGEPIKLKGFFDDTATTGPHVVMGVPDSSPQASTRTLAVVVGNSKTFTAEGYITDYAVIAKGSKLTDFEATYHPTGSCAWS
jgi:hypothetical protein